MIVFQMSTTSKSVSSNQLAPSLGINLKTAWLFEQKVRIAMKSSENYPLKGEVDVDEAFIGGKEDGHQGRGNESKSTIVVAIEKTKNDDGIKRAYALKIDNTSSDELVKIFQKHTGGEPLDEAAHITTDKWTGYSPLTKNWNITQQKSIGGENFQLMHRLIQGVKSWIRGIFHKVSTKYLQVYLDEYCYRFNRNIFKKSIFDNLIQRMIKAKPNPYNLLFDPVSI